MAAEKDNKVAQDHTHDQVDKGSGHGDPGDVPTYGGLSGTPLLAAITSVATCGFLLFGYDQGVMSGIISAPQFVSFPALDPEVQGQYQASLLQATYTSIYEVGCLFGAVGALIFGNKLGRRMMCFSGCWVMIVGVLLQVTAMAGHHASKQWCIGRVVTGIGNGMNTATIPTWQAEVSKSHNRGLLVCIEASMIATGTAISYWIDFGLSYEPGDASWRVPIALQIIFALVVIVGVLFLPDSPRWEFLRGNHEEGRRICAALEGAGLYSEEANNHVAMILDALSVSTKEKPRVRDMLTGGPSQHLRRALLGASSQFFQQIGGCNAVIYFAPVIFEERLNLDRTLALIMGGVLVTLYAFAAFVSFFLVDTFGRRKLFLLGACGQCLGMVLLFACSIPGTESAYKGAVVGMFIFLITFGFTWLQLPWLYPAEINPLATRTNANAFSTMTNWSWNFAVVQWTPPMLTSIDWGTFLFFAVLNGLFVPVVFFFYPETKGKMLEEVDLIFTTGYVEGKSYVSVANHMPKRNEAEITAESQRLQNEYVRRTGDAEAVKDIPQPGTTEA